MNKKYKRIIIVLLLISFILIMTASCSNTKEEIVFRINCSNNFSNASLQIIRELNLLEKYLPSNVTVEWHNIESSVDMRDALIADRLDIAEIATINFVASIDNELPLVIVSNGGFTLINVYSKRDDINSLEDFSTSDSIAILNRASNLQTAFMAKCKQVLGDPMALDSTLVAIPPADAIASLQSSNDFDGGIFTFPNIIRVQEIEGMKLVSDMNDVVEEYGVGTLALTTENFFNKHPELLEAFVNAKKDAHDYAMNNKADTAELLASLYQIDAAHVLIALNSVPFTHRITGYDKQAELIYETGLLHNRPKQLSELLNYENLEIAS